MALREVSGISTGDSSEDLEQWLRALSDCPPVTHTLLATCDRHGAERQTWTYIEADAAAGVARRRCVACGNAHALLDSAERWSFPPMHSCGSCAQSLVEVAAGVSVTDGGATWLVLAARCVDCGRIEGLTDLLLPRLPLDDVAAGL